MIPYFRLTSFVIGPLTLQVWGFFVALGIFVATFLGYREAKQRGFDGDIFIDFATWILIFAMIGGRLFHVFVYNPSFYLANPSQILRIWEGGMSSFGGFIGALIGALLFVMMKKVSFWRYADIGRIGCFLIHDHPGTLSHSLFAVRYPDGNRFDHGFLLSLLGFAIFSFFWFVNRRHTARHEKGFLPLFMVCYGTVRFFLDFYRAWDLTGSDVRYFLLTPGQYGSIFFVIFGIILLYKFSDQKYSNESKSS